MVSHVNVQQDEYVHLIDRPNSDVLYLHSLISAVPAVIGGEASEQGYHQASAES